jgi:hypothetical protein
VKAIPNELQLLRGPGRPVGSRLLLLRPGQLAHRVAELGGLDGRRLGSGDWLRHHLAASSKPCTAAYWHKPLFTSASNHAPETATRPLFQALYDNNAEIVMAGHNHNYERFAPMNPQGVLDNTRGIQSFVAGMGGVGFYGFGTIQPNSLARNNDTFGVLKMTLHSNSWDWAFVPQAGKTYNDSGSGTCH